MAKGAFNVGLDASTPRDIAIRVVNGIGAPEDQMTLVGEVGRTLGVLDRLYPAGSEKEQSKFKEAQQELLGIARVGLVGEFAQPEIAHRALENFKAEIVSKEGGRVKNAYMRKLGRCALVAAVCGAAVWVSAAKTAGNARIALQSEPVSPIAADIVSSFAVLWIGCMAGVWLSFGYRKIALTFEELTQLEQDQLEPPLRLVFAGLMTLLLGLFFYKEAIAIEVGKVSTAAIVSDPLIALILGAVCGFSELTLAGKVAKHASAFLESK